MVEIIADVIEIGNTVYVKGIYTDVLPECFIYYPQYSNKDEKWYYLTDKFLLSNKTWQNIDLSLTWNEMISKYL